MVRQIPAPIQETLALLLAVVPEQSAPWSRVSEVHLRFGSLVAAGAGAPSFNEQLDSLIQQRYVSTDDTRMGLAPYGEQWLLSVAELAAAELRAGDEVGRMMFDRLSEQGWHRLLQIVDSLPESYSSRRGDYFVYVALLHNDVARLKRFREANRGRLPGRPSLYVGMSSLPPLQRFRNHKQGYKSSRYPRYYGLCLVPELYEHLNPLDRHGAAAMEKTLAADLRSQGYGVMGVYERPTAVAF